MLRAGRSLVTGLTRSGVRLALLDATKATNEAIHRHKIVSAVPAQALGRCIVGAVLLNMTMKGDERVELQLLAQDENAPLQKVHVEAISTGEVRGHVLPKEWASVGKHRGFEGLGEAPILHVSKVLYSKAAKQQSYVEVPHGSVLQGLQLYFERSEQIDTFLTLDTKLTPADQSKDNSHANEISFESNGAILAQRMPGVDEASWRQVVDVLQSGLDLTTTIQVATDSEGTFRRDIKASMEAALPSLEFDPTAFNRKQIDFYCRCSRQSFLHAIQNISANQKQEMTTDGEEPLVVTCEHCNETYTFHSDEILGS